MEKIANYEINSLIKDIHEKRNEYCNSLAMSNLFIVKLPKEIGIEFYDILSFEFIDKKTCRIIVRDNFVKFPIFTINEYIDKKKETWFFKKSPKDNMVIEYLDRTGCVKYVSTLEDIRIDRVRESKLSYADDGFHTLTLDISFKKRILNINGTTDKE